MFIGNFNRLIQIQKNQTTKNTFGEDVIEWVLVEEVYSEKFDKVRNEKFEANQKVYYEESVFSIYHIENINTQMRVLDIDDNKYYEIIATKEIGYKEGLQLTTIYKDNF